MLDYDPDDDDWNLDPEPPRCEPCGVTMPPAPCGAYAECEECGACALSQHAPGPPEPTDAEEAERDRAVREAMREADIAALSAMIDRLVATVKSLHAAMEGLAPDDIGAAMVHAAVVASGGEP